MVLPDSDRGALEPNRGVGKDHPWSLTFPWRSPCVPRSPYVRRWCGGPGRAAVCVEIVAGIGDGSSATRNSDAPPRLALGP
jgi:hypothetical protein